MIRVSSLAGGHLAGRRWLLAVAVAVVCTAAGMAGTISTVSAATAAPKYLFVSSHADRSGAVTLNDTKLSGKQYIFYSGPDGVEQVTFYLDGSKTPVRTEQVLPFDFSATAADGTANPFDVNTLKAGAHSITYTSVRGEFVVSHTIPFTVVAKPITTTTTAKPITTTTTAKPITPSGIVAKPTAANTGVPAGTVLTTYTGPSTITVDGTVIDGKAVYVDLKIAAKNVVIKNSYLHGGTGNPSGNTGCIDANSANIFNLTVQDSTIIPDHPSYYRDGIVGHEYTAIRSEVAHSNDGFGIFNKPGGATTANVTLDGNYVHDLTRWNADPAHSDGTHNDGVQIQGGSNIHIFNNNIIGTVVAGDGLGTFGNFAGAGIIVVPHTAPISNLVIENNWLDGGQNTVDIDNASYPTITATLRNNLFGRHQYVYSNGSTYQIRIIDKAASTVPGLYTNKWEDNGALLTDGRDTGIRYNVCPSMTAGCLTVG